MLIQCVRYDRVMQAEVPIAGRVPVPPSGTYVWRYRSLGLVCDI